MPAGIISHQTSRRKSRDWIRTLGVTLFLSLVGLSSPQNAEAQTTINICDRTPQIEAVILKALGKTEADCGSITPAELAKIKDLSVIKDSTLTTLKNGDFDGLTSLTRLDLDKNSLSSLPSDVFDGLTSLTHLDLNGNSLSSLPSDVFDGLTNLENLSLYLNRLSSLPADVFDDLTSLKWLSLQANSLSSLPSGVFDKLTRLDDLDLHNNNLSSLPAGIFDKLTTLRSLYLGHNNLSSLPARVFDKINRLGGLRSLSLHHNNLSSLPGGVFDKLIYLDSLTLNNNNLSRLPAGMFDKLTWLDTLYLGLNPLTCLPSISSSITNLFLDKARTAYPPCAGVTVTESGGYTSVSKTSSTERTDTYTVVLAIEPRSTVTITVTSSDTGAATVSPATLTFTTSNWNSGQTVTVTGLDNSVDQGNNRTVSISHSATSSDASYNGIAIVDVTATVVDGPGVTIADSRGVRYSCSEPPVICLLSLSVTEAAGTTNSDTYTVVLNTQPTANVEIFVANVHERVYGVSAATVSPSGATFLTFTPSNWNSRQTVTVTGLDDFVAQSSDRNVTIAHSSYSSDASYNLIHIVDVRVRVVDDDEAGVSINQSDDSTSVTEASGAGRTDTYTVKLATLPTGSVTVAVTSGAPGAATVSPTTLTFTPSNWNSGQTVTVTGVDDFVAQSSDRSVTISHSATSSDANYNGVAIDDVTATVVDDDGAGVSINQSDDSTSVTEASGDGRTDSYTMVLEGGPPTASVRVEVVSGDSGAATVSPATLTFTTSDWNSGQTVTVTGVDDFVAQSSGRSVTISHSATSSDANYNGIAIADVTATVVDDDSPGVSITDSSGIKASCSDLLMHCFLKLSVTEASGTTNSDSYTVTLNTQPAEKVSIAVVEMHESVNSTAAVTVSPATLTFTTSDWNSGQTVTVTGVDDFVAQSDDRSVTIIHLSDSGDANYSGLAIAGVITTVVDDDGAGVSVNQSDGSTSVTEASGAGHTDSYVVKLATLPTGSVTVAVTSGAPGAATVSPATLTFTPSDWNSGQTVTVTGVDDFVAQGSDRSVTISHSATSSDDNYNGIAIADVTATVVDDDSPGVSISGSVGITVTEASGTTNSDTYTVVLNTQPTGNVGIAVANLSEILSSAPSAATVNPATLTFTPSDWNSGQTVTVTGVDDSLDQETNRSATIRHTSTSSDAAYNGIAIADVTVTVLDDDTAGVSIIESSGSTVVSETAGGDRTDTYTVKLATLPTGSVTVAITSSAPGAATVSPATLTFTPSDWNSGQTVTVTGVEDSVDQGGSRRAIISHSATSRDANYNTIIIADVRATVVDDDTAGVSISESSGATAVSEAAGAGHSDSYTVALDTRPTSSVTVEVVSGDSGAATVRPATLRFSTTNWNSGQTVTVSGVEDSVDQGGNRRVRISHSAASSDVQYRGIRIPDVTATVLDDDTAGVSISQSNGATSVSEAAGVGRTDGYTVVLNSEPISSVTVEVVSGDREAATVSPATLTFTPTNWNTVQPVTVSGVDDHVDQRGSRSVTIAHRARSTDPAYEGISILPVSATVTDDDTAGVSVIESDGFTAVSEAAGAGQTDTYTVVLTSEPTDVVRVSINSGTPGAALVNGPGDSADTTSLLSFTPSTWSSPQTVTVSGVDDNVDQSGNRSVSISHGASSQDPTYEGISIPSVSATVMDDGDGAGVRIIQSGGATVVTEAAGAGQRDSYTVALTSEPTHEVRVTVVSGTPGAALVNGAGTTAGATSLLTFTPSTWSTPQTVTVTGVDDSVNQGVNRSSRISHSASSQDPAYEGISIPSVSATVTDNDTVGVTITESDGATVVTEGSGTGQRDSYTVALTSEPTDAVRITVVSGAPGAALVNVAGGAAHTTATLTFAPSTWSAPQTVTVTGVDDSVGQSGSRSSSITHRADSQDPTYEGISIPSVSATVVDNDTVGVTMIQSGGATAVTEAAGAGQTDSYTVALTSEPTHGVMVMVVSGTPSAALVNGPGATASATTTLTFTPSTWSRVQTVTVTGVDDKVDQAVNRISRLEHRTSSADPIYDGISIPWVSAVVVDDENAVPDTRVVDVTTGSGTTIGEGDSATFTFTANPAPGAGSTMTVSFTMTGAPFRKRTSGAGHNEGSASAPMGGAHSIIIDDSGMAQFTVSTLDNSLSEGKVKITATVDPGVGYSPHPRHGAASVTVVDDDPGLMLSADSLSVEAGGSASYTMALATEPMGEVTVSISGGEGSGVTAAPTHLTFSQGNWDRPQSVGIRAAETSPALAAPVTLSHTASGGNYGGLTADVVVNVAADAVAKEAKKAWHLRLGRTISHQMVDALQDRLAARPAAGLQVTLAGEAITDAPPLVENQGILSKALGFETVSPEALVEGSSFSFAPAGEGSRPQVALWGQGALSSFRGEQDDISLDGDVTTLLLGADWTGRRWQAGAALSQSWGHGSYGEDNNDGEGEINSTVTGLFPYGRYALTPRLGLWAVAGYGWGQLFLKPDGEDGMEEEYKPSTTMVMGAIGMDGLLRDGGSKGITLKSTADVLTVKTTSEEVDGLDSSEGSLSRLRLGVEAVRPFPLANGSSLLPSMELGIRQDSGDAETGFGMDLGAGILWQAPGHGISGELKGHTLLTHAEEEFQDQGLALSFSWEPNPSNRGPSLSIGHTMGAAPSEGMDALLHPTTMEGLDATPNSGQRFEAEVAYGFPAHNDRLTITPAVEMAFSSTSRNYNLLWSVAPHAHQTQGQPWELSLEGGRHEQLSSTAPPDHSLKLTFSTLF